MDGFSPRPPHFLMPGYQYTPPPPPGFENFFPYPPNAAPYVPPPPPFQPQQQQQYLPPRFAQPYHHASAQGPQYPVVQEWQYPPPPPPETFVTNDSRPTGQSILSGYPWTPPVPTSVESVVEQYFPNVLSKSDVDYEAPVNPEEEHLYFRRPPRLVSAQADTQQYYELFSNKPQLVQYPFKRKVYPTHTETGEASTSNVRAIARPITSGITYAASVAGNATAPGSPRLKLPEYTCTDLLFPGVTICNAQFQVTIPWSPSFMVNVVNSIVRRYRCFRYNVIVYSAVQAASVIKVFIGPKLGADRDDHTVLRRARKYFIELDCFQYHLIRGLNTIRRYSLDYRGRMERYQFHHGYQPGRPYREYKLFYIVVPYPHNILVRHTPHNFESARGIYPYEFPLERPITSDWFHILNNSYLQDFSMICG